MGETKPLDGLSLVPLLDGEAGDWPDRKLFSRWGRRGGVRTQEWRATRQGDNWRLYNMIADPNQENDVAEANPVVLRELSAAYDAWEKDVTRAGFDPIPIPIGYPERPIVTMPGHEAFLHPAQGEGISYLGRSGWANDYVTNWTDVDAYPFWEVDVVNPGTYQVTLLYTATAESLGTRLRVEIGGQATEGTLAKEHNPEHIPSPDRVPRGEVYEKVWAPLELGTVTLKKGKTQLAVKALNKPGHTVMELKAVRVRKVM
jgi:arylsulfatase A